jgi:hypothetical protein
MHGLSDTFINLGLHGQHVAQESSAQSKPQVSDFEPNTMPSLAINGVLVQQNTNAPCPMIPSLNQGHEQPFVNPVLMSLDNFYMNYSNSPLSGGKGNMFRDFSDSSSRRLYPKEFDSFSEMITSFQSQNRNDDAQTRPLNFNLMKEENLMLNETMGNALDTYRSIVDAQWVLSDAFQKTSYLSDAVQRMGFSPMNVWSK